MVILAVQEREAVRHRVEARRVRKHEVRPAGGPQLPPSRVTLRRMPSSLKRRISPPATEIS